MAHAVLKVNQSTIQQMKNTYQSAILPSTPPPRLTSQRRLADARLPLINPARSCFKGMKLKKKRVDGEIQDLTIKRKKQKPIEACRPF